MNVKSLRQLFKACADDTRLRIINLLRTEALTVKEICDILTLNQPTISKHLTKLRLLKLVVDRRSGNLVYYTLNQIPDISQGKIISFILSEFPDINVFKRDREALRKTKKT